MKSVSRLSPAVLVLSITAAAVAQERVAEPEAFAFPELPQQWINSKPLTLEQLKGKAVFLWFFEEDCPRCREKWPGLLSLSQRYADRPVLFVAVNSGTQRGEIERYVKTCKITWPVILDPARELEKAAGIGEISLQNIYQAKVILPDGTLGRARADEIEGSVDTALQTAAWKVDPKEVPALLKNAWNEIELGNYAAAAAALKRSLNSPKEDVKVGAEKLQAVVTKDLDERLTAAKEALDAEDKWKAYRLYTEIVAKFAGYDLPEEVEKQRKALSTDPKVKEEVAALKVYDTAVRQMTSAAPQQRKRGLTALEKLVKEKPETEAARKAQIALSKANG